jgi:type II secretory pathway predicted ATPase ExeA
MNCTGEVDLYRDFYGIREKPFSKTPDPRFLFMGRGHREGFARLQYAVEERETALLTGGIGCGKTTMSRALMDALGDAYRFCFVVNPKMQSLALLRTIARGLGMEMLPNAKDDLVAGLSDLLVRYHEEMVCPVVVIDEAHLIPDRDGFEEIRLLTNIQLDDRNLLSVILMGQPELAERLRHPALEPLRQRIGISFHLDPLDLEETQEYLDFRMVTAGGGSGLFTPDAVARIFDCSGGVPRRINALATNALLAGYERDATIINLAVVDEIAGEQVV